MQDSLNVSTGAGGRSGFRARDVINRNQGVRLSAEVQELGTLVDEARRSAPLFTGGGGVTLTGGEPTLQFPAVRALLARLREAGLDTALETNASHPRLPELFPLVDFLIMDYKHHEDATLCRVTGVGNRVIHANLEQAFALRRQLLVRIPVIPGFNDAAADPDRFAGRLSRFGPGRASFEFLPFHEYGKVKWGQCGLPYRMPPAVLGADTLARFRAAFLARGLHVVAT